MLTAASFPDINYRETRLRWCYVNLIDFLRRWRGYIAAGIFVLGSSSLSGSLMASIRGLLAVTVLPMFWALQQPLWLIALATAGYCTLGFIVCWGLRPLLWSAEWRDVESTLPIPPREQRLSDLTVVVISLTPLFALYVAGVVIWWVYTPASNASLLLPALAMLLFSMLTSVMSGMWILQSMRQHGRASNARLAFTLREDSPQSILKSTSVCTALIVLPLVRGPAKRGGRLLLFVPLLAVANVMPIFWPALTPSSLAAFAFLILLLTTRLNAVLQSDLVPLHAACAPLPVDVRRLLVWRCAVAMLPITVTMALLLPVLLWISSQLRPFVAASYLLVAFIGNLLQVLATSIAPRAQIKASTRGAAWLLVLLVQITLASEVMAK